ncbi:MAG: tyrosine-type recombinase/integrase [Bifidobacterium dentium]
MMPRPRIPIGQHGTFRYTHNEGGQWVAHCRMRMNDGSFRQLERSAPSKERARILLEEYCQQLKRRTFGAIEPNTTLGDLAGLWLATQTGKAENTINAYTNAYRKYVSRLDSLTIAEATPLVLQTFLDGVAGGSGSATVSMVKLVLSGMMEMAVAQGAILHNPVRDLKRMSRHREGSVAIPADKVQKFLKAVETNEWLVSHDEADIIRLMLYTGLRVGEACGLCWDCVDFTAGTLSVERIAIRRKGEGMTLQAHPKTEHSRRTITAPKSIMHMLELRRISLDTGGIPNPHNLVFPRPLSGGSCEYLVRSPNVVASDLRREREALGFGKGESLSPHSLRKTCASLLHDAGLNTLDVADYLGHSDTATTENVYIARGRNSGKAANALETMIENAG